MTAKRPLILIADDAPEEIAIYKRHLTREQSGRYKILKATTGAKALAICERRRPDCLLLDFRLPDLNGLEVLQALAGKSGVLPFAVVVLAEVGDTHIVVDAMKYGAHDFLEKSWITPEILERAVANAIEKAALQREVVEQRRELETKNLALEQRLADLQREMNERRQVEEALTAIERRFKRLIEAQPSIVWMSDAVGSVTFMNDYWTELTGQTFEQSLGVGWLTAVHPDDAARLEADWNQAVVAGSPHESRHRYLRPDGEYRWHLCRSVPLRDESGAIQEWVGVSVDIHDRLRAEEALRLANDRFTVAEAAANGYVYDRDPVTNRVERSAGFGAVLGYDESETAGTHNWWRTLIHPDDIHRVKAMLDQASSGLGMDEMDGYSLEYRIRHKDGRYLWVWDRGRVMRDKKGRVRRVIGTVVDISGRKQIENSLRENESRLKLAITAMNGGAWEWDLITDEVRWSDEMYEFFDRRPGDFKPTVEGWLKTLSAENCARAADVIEAIRRGEDAQMVYCATGSDGAARWLELRGITLHDDRGRPVLLVGITIDITERKLAEEALRESEALAHTLAANLSDGLIYQMRRGPDGSRRFLYISENVERLRGVTAEEAMADADKLYNLVPEDYRQRLIEAEDAALRDFTDFRFETPFLTQSGDLRWSQQSSSPRRLSDGSVVWDGVDIDITDRKRAEETLRESEEKFSKVFKASPHRIAITTLDEGRYIDVNDAVLRTTGYERSEMIGRTGEELQMFAWRGGREEFFHALQNGPVRDMEVPLRSKSGEIRTVLMSADIITLNGRKCILAVSNDITERKRTEEALRESEEKFSKVFQASPHRITISTLDEGRYIDVNDAVLSGTGYERSEMIGRTANEIKIFAGAGRKRLSQALEDGSVRDLEVGLRSKNGDVRTVLMSAEIVTLNGRQCVVTLSNDITERKQAEEELREKERFIQSLIDAVPAGIYIYDLKERRNLFTNPRLASLLGYTTDELTAIGSDFLGLLLHPEDRRRAHAHSETLREAPDGSVLEIEYRMKHRDGHWRWVVSREMVFRRDADGRPSQILGLWQEITERKLAEEELQRANLRYQITLDALDGYIYEYNVGDNSSERSKGLAKLIGFEPEEAPPRLEWWIDHIHPDDRDRFRSEVGKMLAEESAPRGETPYSMEYRMLHRQGHYVDVLDRFLVVRDANGRPMQVVGAVINITERKRVEETLRENEERLLMTMEAANAGSFDWDIAAGTIFWTPGRHASSGTRDIEQDYQSWRAAVHPEDIDWVEADIAKSLAEQRDLYVEYRVLRPDGSVRWVSNIGHAFYNEEGEPTRMKGLRIDLTDRKRAEELLRESEERLRLALEGAKAGVWEVKFDPYSAHWSKEYRDLFGFSETDEATNELWATRVHPDDLQRVVDGNNALLNSDRNEMRQEFRIIHPEHGERWILDFVRVRRDQSGRPISFGGINLDVTDRRRAEGALRESEERFRELVETISDVFWIMSPESQAPTYLSPACERLWGRPAKELNGNLDRWFDAIHHEDRERVRKKYLATAGEGGYDETYRVVRPDGSMVWVHDRGFPVCDEAGDIRHIVGVAEDVTERKRFEDEVRESQRRYAALAEAVPQLVWTAAADGAVDYFNQRWHAYTGTTPDESLNQAWRSLIHPDDRERVEKLWKRSVRLGEHLHFEFRLRSREGGYRWFIGRAVPYREERRGATPRKQDGENGAAGAGNGAALNGGKGRIVKWFGTFTDIHDLKIAEEALRESEEHARRQNAELENIYQATPVGLSLLDRDFRFVRVNETMARIDGASVSRALGRTAREVTPKIADRLEPVFKRVIRTGRPIMNLEIRVETPHEPGVDRDWLASYYPVKAADGSVQGIGCVVLDITERKRAEEALRESEERLRQAAQAAGFGLYSVNLQTGENYWSPELRRIFGLSDDDAVKLDGSLGLIHPDDRERTMRVIEAALDPRGDGEFEHEFRAQLPDGNTRWALAKGKTLFVGNGRRRKAGRIIGVAFDITKRREDEERLSASERRLKLSLTAGHAGTWEWRIKEDRLIWSDEYYELYGMAPGDLEPTLDSFILCVHPEDRDRILVELSEVLQERKDAELEFRFIRAGGESRWAHSSAQLTLDESGEPEMMVGIIIDITERKQAEMEREELLRKEREAREQAEDANRGKDEFVAMVSHELRSPLNAMLGWSKILKKGGVDAKTQSHAVEVIERSARAQQTLIEDLLDMARIVGGKLRLETRPVSLSRVVEAAADVVRPAAVAREINLRLFINSADEVTGDPDRLQQVVWNLLSNAVKFTTRGGSVEVILERVGASAQITVTDTGRGIKAEDLPFIFDRFRQADSSSTRRFAGLGLGLALVKHLVELHGGQVFADSSGEGEGASFIVRLPVRAVRGEATPARGMDRASLRIEERDGRITEREARSDFPAFPLDGVWALIVDDEADARELIATLLKQYGARVTVASCAAEAFDKLRNGEAGARPDVLISDISMPDEDGYMLIERVRKLRSEEGGKIPAIALTALERPNDRIRALASGFSMHVPKPVEPEELAMVVANLTGHPAAIIL